MILFGLKPVLITAAIIPALILFIYIYKTDTLEKESPRLMFSLVKAGVVSTFSAMATELIGTFALSFLTPEGTLLNNFISNFIVVALSEEGFKYLYTKRNTWHSSEFNCRFDGVVYAASVSLGFAVWENIGYVLKYGFSNAIVRAFTAIPGHACFGIFMGVWYGFARQYENMSEHKKSMACRRRAIIIPVLLHGTYDFLACLESEVWTFVFIPFIAVIFLAAFIALKKYAVNDTYIDR